MSGTRWVKGNSVRLWTFSVWSASGVIFSFLQGPPAWLLVTVTASLEGYFSRKCFITCTRNLMGISRRGKSDFCLEHQATSSYLSSNIILEFTSFIFFFSSSTLFPLGLLKTKSPSSVHMYASLDSEVIRLSFQEKLSLTVLFLRH